LEYRDDKAKKQYRAQIKSLQDQINDLYNLKHYLDFLTLEKHCENLSYEYIIANTLYYHDTNSLVFNYSNLNNVDSNLFNNLINMISNSLIDVSTLKKIVISEYWRSYYSNNRDNIFSYPASEYTEEQKSLMNLSTMYESIYQHPECPRDEIIQDEDALDGWMVIQKEKNKKEKAKKGVSDKMSSKVKDSNQIFIPLDATEDAEDIFNLSEGKEETDGIQRFINAPDSN